MCNPPSSECQVRHEVFGQEADQDEAGGDAGAQREDHAVAGQHRGEFSAAGDPWRRLGFTRPSSSTAGVKITLQISLNPNKNGLFSNVGVMIMLWSTLVGCPEINCQETREADPLQGRTASTTAATG